MLIEIFTDINLLLLQCEHVNMSWLLVSSSINSAGKRDSSGHVPTALNKMGRILHLLECLQMRHVMRNPVLAIY